MSTADEILLMLAESAAARESQFAAVRQTFDTAIRQNVEALMLTLADRHVHAARARKLRRRGDVVRYFGRTSTGLAIYRWMPRIPRIVLPESCA